MSLAIHNGHVVDRPIRELTDDDAHRVTVALAEQGIRVEPVVDVYRIVHLWAQGPCDTLAEVRAIAMFRTVTDCRLAWHGAGAS